MNHLVNLVELGCCPILLWATVEFCSYNSVALSGSRAAFTTFDLSLSIYSIYIYCFNKICSGYYGLHSIKFCHRLPLKSNRVTD
jgi:hypothetical protein